MGDTAVVFSGEWCGNITRSYHFFGGEGGVQVSSEERGERGIGETSLQSIHCGMCTIPCNYVLPELVEHQTFAITVVGSNANADLYH